MTAPETNQTVSFWRANRLDASLFVISIMALVILIGILIPIIPEAFELRFNAYSLISLGGLSLNLALLIILIRRSDRSISVMWFALFIVTGLLWSGAEAMERLSATPIGATYWGDLIGRVTTFVPAYFYLFVRSYTSKTNRHVALWVPVFILGTAAMLGALIADNTVFKLPVIAEIQPWGYLPPNSIASVLFISWAGAVTVAAIGRLIGFYRQSSSSTERNLAVTFIVASTGVLIASALTEILLPLLGIKFVPPMGVFSNALLALVVIYGIIKNGSFSIGTGEIADTVLATMAEGVLVTNSSYEIIYRNDKAQELLAGLGKELIGINLRMAYGDRLDKARIQWEQDLVSGGYADTEDIEIGTPDIPVTLNLHVTPMSTEHPGFIFVLTDVTKARAASDILQEQSTKLEATNKAYQHSQVAMLNLLEDSRELETELKREKAGIEKKITERTIELQTERESLEAIINGVDFGIYMLGPDLHVNMVNKPMQELHEMALHKKYTLASFDTDVQGLVETQLDIKEALKTQSSVSRAEYPRGNRILRSFRSPLYEPGSKPLKLLGVINVLQDITEAKAAERSRDEFFSIASHELRTPLTAIRGNTSMIQDYFADQLKDPSLKEMIGDIHDSSVRLITIVNDFLNTSRLEQGKIDFKIEPVDPADLVHEVIKELQAGDTGAKVPFESNLKTVPDVLADHDRLKEVLINLVGNAVKFTDAGSITIGLALDGKNVKLSVTDTGKGIPVGSQGLLFHKFQQASNNILTRDATRSTGLGLYISKLLMTGMGGEIFLEKSAAGKGATFTVLIPSVKPAIPPKTVKTKPALTGVK